MHSRVPLQLFEDIAENISRIENYTRGYDAGKFSEDSMCQDAVQHCLLRLSEAARLLGDEARAICARNPLAGYTRHRQSASP